MQQYRTPPPRHVTIPVFAARHRQLSDSIRGQEQPDALVVDEITQIEGYIAGLREFYET